MKTVLRGKAQKVIVEVRDTSFTVHYEPGLPDNDKAAHVYALQDELAKAVRECLREGYATRYMAATVTSTGMQDA